MSRFSRWRARSRRGGRRCSTIQPFGAQRRRARGPPGTRARAGIFRATGLYSFMIHRRWGQHGGGAQRPIRISVPSRTARRSCFAILVPRRYLWRDRAPRMVRMRPTADAGRQPFHLSWCWSSATSCRFFARIPSLVETDRGSLRALRTADQQMASLTVALPDAPVQALLLFGDPPMGLG